MTDAPRAVSLGERCFDACVRVGKIVHLATCGGSDMDGDMLDWLLEYCDKLLCELLGVDSIEKVWSWVVDGFGEDPVRDDTKREFLTEALYNKGIEGWLVQVETPVRQRTPSGKGTMFSWGYYHHQVFYGETYEEALEKGFVWADEQPVEER